MKNIILFSTEVREIQVHQEAAARSDQSAREIMARIEGRTLKLVATLGFAELGGAEKSEWDNYVKAIPNVFERQYLVHVLADHGVGIRAFLKAVQVQNDRPFPEVLEQAMKLQAAANLEADGPGSSPRFFFN